MDDLIPINLSKGLVRVVSVEEHQRDAYVIINDTGNHSLSTFKVPLEDMRYFIRC